MNIDDIIPVPRDKYDLSFAHAIILEGTDKDSFEQAITFLRKNEPKAYNDIKSLSKKYLRHEIFGDRR